MKDPCTGVCRDDPDTGWCLGCGMARADWRRWKRDRLARPALLAVLPGRLALLRALRRAARDTARDRD